MASIACVALVSGCARFGYYKIDKAERAPLAEAEKVVFPNSYEGGIHLDGPTMAVLEVARNEFMPPGVTSTARDEKLARCLASRDTYDVTVLKANDDLYFVSFLPRFSRCGIELETPIMDAGATYAIDRRGRILGEL